ncbi:MAG: redoxin domain-containing protein [Acidobacteriota bacterium]|nr:redoxin domain-containing protein [Acidobacteriota bacterium]
MELVQFQNMKAEFDALNVNIVAVTVEDAVGIRRTRKRTKAAFDFVRDTNGQLMDLFGLRDDNPNPSGGSIPRSARILIDGNGKVLWLDRSDNYRVRPDVDNVLSSVRDKLQS